MTPFLPLLLIGLVPTALARPFNGTGHCHRHNGTHHRNDTSTIITDSVPTVTLSATTVSIEAIETALTSTIDSQSSSATEPTISASVVVDPIYPSQSSSSAIAAVSSSTAAASSTTASAAVSSPSISPDSDEATLLPLHNNFRALYGASPVTWNSTLAAYAADHVKDCVFVHTHGPYGENIAKGVGGGYNTTSGFDSWANEASLYDWSEPGYQNVTGHFTQVVWKGTSQIGCATYSCPDGTLYSVPDNQPTLFLMCEYYEAGNIVGDDNEYFIENVGTYQA